MVFTQIICGEAIFFKPTILLYITFCALCYVNYIKTKNGTSSIQLYIKTKLHKIQEHSLKNPVKYKLLKRILVDLEFFSVDYVFFLVIIVVFCCVWVIHARVAYIYAVCVHG